MKLVCPQCQYSKELDEAVIPTEMVYATCPQCTRRFRFRGEEQGEVRGVEPEVGAGFDTAEPSVESGAMPVEERAGNSRVNSARFAARNTDSEPENEENKANGEGVAATDPRVNGSDYFGADSSLFQESPETHQKVMPDIQMKTIPWAWRREIGYAAAFIATVREVLLAPAVFFSRAGGEWKKAGVIPFYIFCTGMGMLISQIWAWAISTFLGDILSEVAIGAAGGPFVGWGMALGLTAVTTVFAPLFLLITAGVVHGGLRVTGAARNGFGATAMVCGFAISSSVLYLVPFIGQILAGLWGLFIMLVGLKHAHQTTLWRVVAGLLLPVVCLLLLVVVAGVMNS